MRAFIAVFPPPKVREEALAAARRLPLGDQVRWLRPENVHLTLKFLGDVQEQILESVRAALGEVCAAYTPFNVELAGLGAFPSARRSRILWAGVGEGSEQLRSLAADLDAAFALLGFERERRPYTPHLTIGRVRGKPANLDLPTFTGNFEFKVGDVELVKSVLTPEGAVYEILDTFALGESSRRIQP